MMRICSPKAEFVNLNGQRYLVGRKFDENLRRTKVMFSEHLKL